MVAAVPHHTPANLIWVVRLGALLARVAHLGSYHPNGVASTLACSTRAPSCLGHVALTMLCPGLCDPYKPLTMLVQVQPDSLVQCFTPLLGWLALGRATPRGSHLPWLARLEHHLVWVMLPRQCLAWGHKIPAKP